MIFYDAGRYIEEAIDSVIAQTWLHWELLLVDDGSRDASREIAERFRQRLPEKIRILEHPGHANCGMSASRNAGLAAARGDFIAFLDADDVYLPTRLERHVSLLQQHPAADVVQSCVEFWSSWPDDPAARRQDVPERCPPVRLTEPVQPPELLLLMLYAHGTTVPGICSLTLRRDLLQSIGGSAAEFRTHYEDQVLYAKIYLSGSVLVIPDRLAKYRQHSDSLTGSVAAAPHRWQIGRAAFLDWLEAWLIEQKIEDELVWQGLRKARIAPGQGLLDKVLRQFLAALRRLAEIVLPRSLSVQLIDWWGRRKLAMSAFRVARVQSQISQKLGGRRRAVNRSDRQRSEH
jgi:glycosyltransferase involved in cell wall biosynthesis